MQGPGWHRQLRPNRARGRESPCFGRPVSGGQQVWESREPCRDYRCHRCVLSGSLPGSVVTLRAHPPNWSRSWPRMDRGVDQTLPLPQAQPFRLELYACRRNEPGIGRLSNMLKREHRNLPQFRLRDFRRPVPTSGKLPTRASLQRTSLSTSWQPFALHCMPRIAYWIISGSKTPLVRQVSRVTIYGRPPGARISMTMPMNCQCVQLTGWHFSLLYRCNHQRQQEWLSRFLAILSNSKPPYSLTPSVQ
mmetsp:Transcript_18152/g.50525  ORF Transcript_18152/g.50525 Transcript_18152/m.50525 type:complete len:248 (-) Transcript_18152:2610-3353(-)